MNVLLYAALLLAGVGMACFACYCDNPAKTPKSERLGNVAVVAGIATVFFLIVGTSDTVSDASQVIWYLSAAGSTAIALPAGIISRKIARQEQTRTRAARLAGGRHYRSTY